MLVDFSAATLGAPQSALDIDVAELLVACTVLVGPDRALRAALEAGGADAVGRVRCRTSSGPRSRPTSATSRAHTRSA